MLHFGFISLVDGDARDGDGGIGRGSFDSMFLLILSGQWPVLSFPAVVHVPYWDEFVFHRIIRTLEETRARVLRQKKRISPQAVPWSSRIRVVNRLANWVETPSCFKRHQT